MRIPAVKPKPGQPRLDANKVFSDGVWGGREKALVAAQRWRNKALKQFPRPEGRYYNSHDTVPPGHGYIRFAMLRYPHRNRKKLPLPQPAWLGWLRIEDRKCKGSSASIDRWGREGAYQRVEAWLEKERQALAARMGISYAKLMQQARKESYRPRTP